jgi:hypothetical protein
MATSIQVSSGRAEAFNDLDLLVLLHLMLQAASQMSQTPATVEIVARLRATCEDYGPGSIDLQLDDIRTDEALRNAYLGILRMAMDRLDSAGSVLPAEAIMTGWLTRGVRINDFSVELIHTASERLRKLVEV